MTASPIRLLFPLLTLAATLVLTGCVTLGSGITERDWRAAWDVLAVGHTQSATRDALGPP
ncbi:MAG: hypothetical protein J6386_02570 [Candidatus Synoicihabitans palmerolidicus]|nr:hypothetical protein [Candidatus Synoicihabitans palmerolidicus]